MKLTRKVQNMQQVKCFLADTTVELENQINAFIHNCNVEITHITYSHLSGDSRALIVYDEKE